MTLQSRIPPLWFQRLIVQKSDEWLAATHDYIQWLFPLPERSQFNPHAPILTNEVCAGFVDSSHPDDAILQKNFGAAITRMLALYGYAVVLPSPDQIAATAEWEEKSNLCAVDLRSPC